jgi:endonuclease YncB( thermonuclease family)
VNGPRRRRSVLRPLGAGALCLLLGVVPACAQQSAVAESERYVASSRGQVYYWEACDAWRSIPDANRRWFESAAEAEAAGYTPSTARGCQGPTLTAAPDPLETGSCTVRRIVDGDTLVCEEAAARIRLLLVDAPELAEGSVGAGARAELERLLPVGTRARVEGDRRTHDRFGRILAYVHTPDGVFVNEALARSGHARLLVVERGAREEQRIRAAEEAARKEGRGIWASPAPAPR